MAPACPPPRATRAPRAVRSMSAHGVLCDFRPLRRVAGVLRRKLSVRKLERERRSFRNRSGTSEETAAGGFVPAFQDTDTGCTYLSRYADGRRAPVHLLDGLPEPLVEERDSTGSVTCVKRSVIAGFCRAGRFYTRAETARLMAKGSPHPAESTASGQTARPAGARE